MNSEVMRRIQAQAKSRIESLLVQLGDDTVAYVVGDATHTELTRRATQRLDDGDYAGAIICEEAAKLIPAADPKPVLSKPMNNVKAMLTVYQEFLVEEVDDMLCVVDQSPLRAGTYTVDVFHRDLSERLVGVKIAGFKNDVVIKLEERVVEIRYMGNDICARCGEEFTKKDIEGGRCTTCGSMIS